MILNCLIWLTPAHHQDWFTLAQQENFICYCIAAIVFGGPILLAVRWLFADTKYRAQTDDHFRQQNETISDLKAQLAAKGKD